MNILITVVTFFTLANALSKKEIESIRKELNNELTLLENINQKRSDNNQVGSVNNNDASDLLNEMSGKGKGKGKGKGSSDGLDSLWQKMVEQRKATEKRELEKALENTKKSTAENTDLEKLFDENIKKSSKKGDDDLEALVKLIFKDKALKRSMGEKKTVKSSKKSEVTKKSTNKKEEGGIVCKDSRSDCANYKNVCKDAQYGKMVKKLCPVTCGICEKCKPDVWTKSTCENIEKLGLCKSDKYVQRLKENCYETCGYCRAPSPPACTLDPQGCCWDKVTFVKDGCFECVDSQSVKRICARLNQECSNKDRPGIWMRKHCPVTCGVCDPEKECHDVKSFKEQCLNWKKEGACINDKYVQKICPRTCNLCHKKVNSVKK